MLTSCAWVSIHVLPDFTYVLLRPCIKVPLLAAALSVPPLKSKVAVPVPARPDAGRFDGAAIEVERAAAGGSLREDDVAQGCRR